MPSAPDPRSTSPQWLRSRLPVPEPAPEALLEACEQASDRAALRRELGLDYERFNRVLLALGESPLSNEAQLRSMYQAYLQQMRPRILERLRRHYAADFQDGRDLATYVDRKTLTFLGFDPAWILSRETLDNEIVEAHVARLLDEVLGEDHEVDLPRSRGLVERNRRSVRQFASRAISVVGAWCRRNRVPVPEPWRSKEPQSVTRHLENAGLLDFEPVHDAHIPGLCARAVCWPPRHAANPRHWPAGARSGRGRRGREAPRKGTPTKNHRATKYRLRRNQARHGRSVFRRGVSAVGGEQHSQRPQLVRAQPPPAQIDRVCRPGEQRSATGRRDRRQGRTQKIAPR